ncbi:MAG: UDP-N-acetylmuramate dehydrogenase [Chlorobiota bacterium]
MEWQRGASLEGWNSFRVPATAAYRVRCHHPEELEQLGQHVLLQELALLVLGRGTNVLFVEDFPGIVCRVEFRGIRCLEDDGDTVCVEVAAGEPWHDFVAYCLQQGWYGVENLALIPGTVGAAPVHNIGAYGVELAEVLEGVQVWDMAAGDYRWLPAHQLGLRYRGSVLRDSLLGRVVITHVRFRLHRRPTSRYEYAELREFLRTHEISNPTPHDIFRAICQLRQRKLPDPAVFPNAGSFFKNPQLSTEQAEELRTRFPTVPLFQNPDGSYKVPAGWLIEQCGWKGKRCGPVGTWGSHALVVVAYSPATGADILYFATLVWRSVYERFGIALEPEVLIVPPTAWQPS